MALVIVCHGAGSTALAQLVPGLAMEAVPTSGSEGTVISVRSVDPCPLETPVSAARVNGSLFQLEGPALGSTEVEVGDDGHWSLQIVVPGPPDVYSETLLIEARCFVPDADAALLSRNYESIPFQYTGSLTGTDGEQQQDSPPPPSAPSDPLPATGGTTGPVTPAATMIGLSAAVVALRLTLRRR